MGRVALAKLNELRFEESGHIYLLNGTQIPSVSSLMNPLSAVEYGEIDKNTLDIAAKRGTSVHNSIEIFLKYGVRDCDPDFSGYADGFFEWWDKNKPEVVGSEFRVYHKLLAYAGTIDMLAYINGKLCLIDFKTTYKLIDKNCRVQLEAYIQALRSHGIEVEKKYILHLCKDGKWDFIEYPVKDAEALRVFMSLKTVYDYLKS